MVSHNVHYSYINLRIKSNLTRIIMNAPITVRVKAGVFVLQPHQYMHSVFLTECAQMSQEAIHITFLPVKTSKLTMEFFQLIENDTNIFKQTLTQLKNGEINGSAVFEKTPFFEYSSHLSWIDLIGLSSAALTLNSESLVDFTACMLSVLSRRLTVKQQRSLKKTPRQFKAGLIQQLQNEPELKEFVELII